MVLWQQAAEFRDGALAPDAAAPARRCVRAGGVVGQREHDGGLSLGCQGDERVDDAGEARQALEHAYAADDRALLRVLA